MRVDEYLDAMRDLPLASLPTITGGKPLILAPHPDDESLGCGGLIAESCAQGEAPLVVVLTDGAASHPNSRAYPPDRLRTTREAETRAAVACLGLPADQVTFLRTPDTRAPTDGPAFAEVVSRLTVLIQRHACRSILASWAHDPHCDHQAAHRIAAAVAHATGVRHRAYPIWGLTLPAAMPLDGPPAGVRLDIDRHLPAKRRAIACHATQYGGIIDDDPDGFQLQPDFIALFTQPTEIYLDVPS